MTDRYFSQVQDARTDGARGDFGFLPSQALPRIPDIFAGGGFAGLPSAVAPASAPASPFTPPPPASAVFTSANRAAAIDFLDHDIKLQPLAELAAHREAQTPACIAVLGAAGTGKSDALHRLAARVEALGKIGPGAFVGPIACVAIDAAQLHGEPAAALAEAVHAGLIARSNGALAHAAAAGIGERQLDAHELADRLDQSRLRLEAQTAALQEISGRRDRLMEVVLNETPGSAIDQYSRANRGMIERRLRSFGFSSADPVANYKDLVRDLVRPGVGLSAFFHALWAFSGQTRLLVWAVILVALSFGIGYVEGAKAQWLDALWKTSLYLGPVGTWIASNTALLDMVRQALLALAAVLILDNMWRAFSFLQPLRKGVRLLKGDLATRQADLDAAHARQERRVQDVARDVEAREKALRSAEQRALEAPGAPARLQLTDAEPSAPAASFFAALQTLLLKGDSAQPRRLFIAIDHLDRLARDRGAEFLRAIAVNLMRPGFVVALAGDAGRFDLEQLDRLVDVPFRIAATGIAPQRAATMALDLLGHRQNAMRTEAPGNTPGGSSLDRPLSVAEARLLADLASIAGRSPRRLTRFINLYRLGRGPQAWIDAPLALLLALQQGGLLNELEAVRAAVAGKADEAEFDPGLGNLRLAELVAQVKQANGGRLGVGQVRAAFVVADGFALRAD